MKVFFLDGGWTKRLRSLKDGEIRRATVQVLRDEGVRGLEQMSLAVGKGGKYTAARTIARLEGAPPSKGLMVRSGMLRRSLGQKVEAKGRRVELALGVLKQSPAARYAAVHEYGTQGKGGKLKDIRPKKGRALAIPMPKALTPTGQVKFTPREAENQYDETFIYKSTHGKRRVFIVGIIHPARAKRRGKGKPTTSGRTRPVMMDFLFMLMSSVSIRARPFVRPAASAVYERLKNDLPQRIVRVAFQKMNR